MHNFASIVQKLMIFFLVKDIDEWNILSLKNNIIVKKKRSKFEIKICNFLSMLSGSKEFISQESPILADFKNII